MTGTCAQCGQLQSLHLMTARKTLHLDRRKGVGKKYLYCTACQAAWLAYEQGAAVREEAPLGGRH